MKNFRTAVIYSDAMPHLLGEPALILSNLTGKESLSTIHSYTLLALTPSSDHISAYAAANINVKNLIGKELTVKIDIPTYSGEQHCSNDNFFREISGIVRKVKFKGMDNTQAIYEIEIKPWIYLTTLTSDYKIFQHKSAIDIISEILAEYHFPFEKRLSSVYPPLDFQVQYGETDFNFIQRIMEEWGIYWFFEHHDHKHRMIIVDHVGALRPFGCKDYHTVSYIADNPLINKEYISQFVTQESITSGRLVTNDFDFTKSRAELLTIDIKPCNTSFDQMEVYQWPGKYTDFAVGEQRAKILMETLAAQGSRATGGGFIRGIVCGHTFVLTDYPKEDANQEYMVLSSSLTMTEVRQRSDGGPLFEFDCSFTVQPATKTYRHPQTIPKPIARGFQSAFVVGPQGQEIWTDQYGRVKVHFIWDRYGIYREGDSCWLRVSQSSAGNSFGSVYIPRIGQEVLVGFINNDPDQPIIVSSLYNNTTTPPWQLPANATQSGLITHTIGGGINNYNGVRFEDLPGQEIYWEQAERDMSRLTKNNEFQTIGQDARLNVGHNIQMNTNNNNQMSINGSSLLNIDNNKNININQNHQIKINGNASTTIGKNSSINIQGEEKTTVNGSTSFSSQGPYNVTSNDEMSLRSQRDININSDQTVVIKARSIKFDADSKLYIDTREISMNGWDLKRVKRAGIEPQYDPTEMTYKEFQQKHFKWRTGLNLQDSNIPKNEGDSPPPTAGGVVADVALGILSGGPLPRYPGISRPTLPLTNPAKLGVSDVPVESVIDRPIQSGNPSAKNIPGTKEITPSSELLDIYKSVSQHGSPPLKGLEMGGEPHIVHSEAGIEAEHPYLFFTDTYKGQPRLNIISHGVLTPGGDSTSSLSTPSGIKGPFDAAIDILQLDGNIQFKNIRCISCHSAEGGIDSFAQKLANYTGVPVKGYHGRTTLTGRLNSEEPVIIKDEIDSLIYLGNPVPRNYQPQKFNPLWRPWE